jgi:hypothetical protein
VDSPDGRAAFASGRGRRRGDFAAARRERFGKVLAPVATLVTCYWHLEIEAVTGETIKNKADCELAASLPALEKQLEELENKVGASERKD